MNKDLYKIYKVYKVVRPVKWIPFMGKGCIVSEGPYSVSYWQLKWANPHPDMLRQGYGLVCFLNLDEAKTWVDMHGVIRSQDCVFTALAQGRMPLKQMRVFWQVGKYGNNAAVECREAWPKCPAWPSGTAMFSRIKIKRLVYTPKKGWLNKTTKKERT